MTGRFVELRELTDHQQRGYIFEQYVRELLPWTFRPPLAISTKSEQLDAFFEFNGWHFLVECKAKSSAITPGSSDWEDFELKVRRRGHVIGLFCSLWPVSDKLLAAADELNRAHRTTIVIAGQQWDEMETGLIGYSEFVRYLVSEARAKNRTKVPSVARIQHELLNAAKAEESARKLLRSASTTFLRRHRSPRHEKLYVERSLDRDIRELLASLTPSRLTFRTRQIEKGTRSETILKEAPVQLAIVRDLSGAGKTTLAAQLADVSTHLSVVRAALEAESDAIISTLDRLGNEDHGLNALRIIDKPLLYVLDSLDEASTVSHKRMELRSLLRAIEDLNTAAQNKGLISFPILLLLTIREEYWCDWEAQLEGRKSRIFARRFSRFSDSELEIALIKYQAAYGYILDKPINADLLEALSHPFTLQIYSEANEYVGIVDAREHFGSRVLTLYFERKKEDLLKRPISGFNGEVMMDVCTAVAVEMVLTASSEVSAERAAEIISVVAPLLSNQAKAIFRVLRSEQIFSADSQSTQIRFRHGRFLEYLIAIEILSGIEIGAISPHDEKVEDRTLLRPSFLRLVRSVPAKRRSSLGSTIGKIYDAISATSFASPYVVFEYLNSLASVEPSLAERLRVVLANSSKFMSAFLLRKRVEIAGGGGLEPEEARAIKLAMVDQSPEICMSGFLVLAAAGSKQPHSVLIEAFCQAWDANHGHSELQKLIPKLKRFGLLLNEEVLRRISKCRNPGCWLTYVEQFDKDNVADFPAAWTELEGNSVERELALLDFYEWQHVLKLLNFLKQGRPYPRGDV